MFRLWLRLPNPALRHVGKVPPGHVLLVDTLQRPGRRQPIEERIVTGLVAFGFTHEHQPSTTTRLEQRQGLGRHRVAPARRPAQEQHRILIQRGSKLVKPTHREPHGRLPSCIRKGRVRGGVRRLGIVLRPGPREAAPSIRDRPPARLLCARPQMSSPSPVSQETGSRRRMRLGESSARTPAGHCRSRFHR